MAEKGSARAAVRRANARKPRSKWVPSAEAAAKEIKRSNRQRYRRHRRRVFLVIVVLALICGTVLSTQVVTLVNVQGNGMSPTMESGEWVLCIKQNFLDKTVGLLPQEMWRIGRGSLVLLDYNPAPDPETGVRARRTRMIKRVIGVGGDNIDCVDGAMTVNGTLIEGAAYGSDRAYPVTVPAKQLFVMGDHRSVAVDSRRDAFGTVPEADVAARPVAVVWPVFALGLVE